MAANVRYRMIYYNTTGDPVTWKLEILDTETVAAVVNAQCTTPVESYEGLTENLNPGIYPSSLTFGMYLRTTTVVRNGVTIGNNSGFWDEVLGAAEGRFLARYYKDDVFQFVGPIIYDQCSKTDESIPLMTITAVDGLNRLKTTDYISEVGQIKYYTKKDYLTSYDDSPLLYDGPTTGITAIVVNHTVNYLGVVWLAITTFAYREVFSINSPGVDWEFQGEGRWAKEIDYTNEIITDNNPESYSLTRDIDDEKHRLVTEYIQRALFETKMTDEYSGVMWDTSSEWYEHSMGDLAADPFTQMRVHEDAFLGKDWNSGMQELCRLLNLRIYYSNGRYHIEQISLRDSTTFTRFIYNTDGTSAGAAETASLDLDFDSLDIEPGTGGTFKILAPLRSVTASITLDNSNLLDGVDWRDGQYGERYLGRVKQVAGDQKLYIRINAAITSSFDPVHLLLFPGDFINVVCEHVVTVYYQVRIVNINTGTTYWLDSLGGGVAFQGEWQTSFAELHHSGTRFGQPTRRYSHENYGYTVDRKFYTLAETLPGSENDMYDIHVSIRYGVEFENSQGTFFWMTLFSDYFWTVINTNSNILRFYSTASLADLDNWIEADGGQSLVYVAENDVSNSVKVSIELQWADTGQHEKSIEIYNGTDWQRSAIWSIGGVGDPLPILNLLVYEVMSLRTVPKEIYSGSFVSSVPNAENRLKRGTVYYLPLSCRKNTDMDSFEGEFLQILKTTPPPVDIIANNVLNDPLPIPTGDIDPPSEPSLYFETNEDIIAGSTLTECDIVNTLGVYVAAGETVTIVNVETGESENVTLTAEILPSSTVMYFESNIMDYSYPDGSPIVVQDGDVVIESGGSKYYYTNKLYNGTEHSVPVSAIDFSVFAGMSLTNKNRKIVIHRNGVRMFCVLPPLDENTGSFYVYAAGNELRFAIEFVDEEIIVDIDLNR